MKKNCLICNEEFEPYRQNNKLCGSVKCKKINRSNYIKKFYKNVIAKCVECEIEFQKKGTQVTCLSPECVLAKNNRYHRDRNARNRPVKIDIQCKECNTVFTPSSSANHIKFCSTKCRFNSWANQPKNKLNWAVQDAVRKGLRPKIRIRKSKYLNGLDFTMGELRTHLENQFDEWMNWNNHGLWHIDHIKPVASFNFTSMEDEEFKECWSLENLQPLKDTENMRKNHYYFKKKELEV